MTSDEPSISRTRRWIDTSIRFLLGPWQPRLRYAYLIIFVSQLFRLDEKAFAVLPGTDATFDFSTATPWEILALIPASAIRALIPTVIAYLLLKALHAITRRPYLTRTTYLIFILLFATASGSLRYVGLGFTPEDHLPTFIALLLRAVFMALMLFGTLGMLEQGFTRQVLRADVATDIIASQRTAVLAAEENARHSIARLLHDKVQAGIVAASLQLLQVKPQAPPEVADRISDVISDLERIRSRDLRAAARQLSPDIAHMHLTGVLEELANSYSPAMDVLIDVRTDITDWDELAIEAERAKLGCYRIVEQALLNAAVHGKAAHVTVVIERKGSADQAYIEFLITDDGNGLPATITPGTGQAVIDAWVAALNATWAIGPGAFGGTAVSVQVPMGKRSVDRSDQAPATVT